MARVEGTAIFRHETVIDMLEKLSESPDFNPIEWSLLDVERLIRFATSIQSRVKSYYDTNTNQGKR